MNNILTAIYSKFSGSALSSAVGGRIYLDRAPDGCQFPYVVYSIISAVPDDNFKTDMDNIYIQFSLFSDSEGATEITTMYNNLKTLFDNAVLTITGSTNVMTSRENLTTMTEEIVSTSGTQKLKHWAVDYSIIVET
jgi:hypothetical protein